MPEMLVAIGLKPLLPFGSHVSIWLGPPSSQSRMHAWALALVGVGPAARPRVACRNWARPMPNGLSEPTRRKSRRFMPLGLQAAQREWSMTILSLMIVSEFARAQERPSERFERLLAPGLLAHQGVQLGQLAFG